MKVIIKKTKQIKDVAFGYAVNYLIPKGLAVKAGDKELQELETEEKVRELKNKALLKKQKQLAKKFDKKRITIKVKAGKDNKLFGSMGKKDILKALKVGKKEIEVLLDKPIRKLGDYDINLKLGKERAKIKVRIKKES